MVEDGRALRALKGTAKLLGAMWGRSLDLRSRKGVR